MVVIGINVLFIDERLVFLSNWIKINQKIINFFFV